MLAGAKLVALEERVETFLNIRGFEYYKKEHLGKKGKERWSHPKPKKGLTTGRRGLMDDAGKEKMELIKGG